MGEPEVDKGQTVRQLRITGDAASAYTHQKTGGRRKTARKQKAQEGGDAPPGQPISTPQNIKNARVMINTVGKVMKMGGGGATPAPAPVPVPQTMPGTTPQNPVHSNSPAMVAQREAGTQPNVLPTTAGGGKKQKIVLGPKKSRKVLLGPPSGKKSRSVTKTRKIRVQLSGLKKRLTKQTTIAKDSREKPLSEIRKLLEEAKLIKPVQEGKSGPPDSVLRDIYKDYLLLRNRAL